MAYEVENTRSQMRKGILEYCILRLIESKESYATEILEALSAANLLVVEGTLYPILSRMKNGGLLTYRWQESPSGPPRKYFRLTEEGKSLLIALEEEWMAISSTIASIGGYSKNSPLKVKH